MPAPAWQATATATFEGVQATGAFKQLAVATPAVPAYVEVEEVKWVRRRKEGKVHD